MPRLLRLILLLLALCSTLSAAFTPIPLGSVANRELEDSDDESLPRGWSGQGSHNSLSGFPRGEVEFLGIPFAIASEGPAALMLRGAKLRKLPATATIPVPGIKAKSLYLLCTAVWAKPEPLAAVTVTYAGGATQVIPISEGDNIQDWWQAGPLPRAVVAWTGKNLMGIPIHAFITPVALERPDSPVESVRFDAGGENEGVFALLGATLGSDAPLGIVPPMPQWQAVADDPANPWFEIPPERDLGTPPVWADAMARGPDARLYALGLVGAAALPPPDRAAALVSRIAAAGFNAIKLGPLDGLLQPDDPDSDAAIDTAKLGRLENLLAEAGKKNLRVILALTGGRVFRLRDRVAGGLMIEPDLRAFPFFDPDVRKLNLEFIRQFLGHVNPHTGLANAADPHIAGLLATQGASIFSIDLDHLPVDSLKSLTRQWNDWLEKKFTGPELAAAWQVPGCPTPFHGTESLGSRSINLLSIFDLTFRRARDARRAAEQIAFMLDLQTRWFLDAERAVRDAGSSAPVAGSDVGGYAFLHSADLLAQSRLPAIWAAEHIENRSRKDRALFFNFSPLADTSPLSRAFDRVAGRPFFLTDLSQSIPNRFACDLLPVYACVAALQGWQGISLLGFSDQPDPSPEMDWLANPSLSPSVPLAHFLFVRGDLPALRDELTLAFPEPAIVDPEFPAANPLFSNVPATVRVPPATVPALAYEPLARRIAVEFAAAPAARPPASDPAPPDLGGRSPDGGLVWDMKAATLTVDAEKTKFFCGGPGSASLGDWLVARKSGGGLASWTSLDGKPLADSRRILVLLTAPSKLKGAAWERQGDFWRVASPGALPLVMEPQTTALEFPVSSPAWILRPLNQLGQILAASPKKLAAVDGRLRVEFSNREARAFLLEAE